MMRPTGPSIFSAILLTAATTPPGHAAGDCASEDEIAAVRDRIEQVNTTIEQSLTTGDIATMASHFTEHAWQAPPQTPPLSGRKAIYEHWTGLQAFGDWAFDLETLAVSLCGPMAVERGAYVLTFDAGPDAPPGMNSFIDRGHYLVQWVRGKDGAWRIAADAPVSLGPSADEAEDANGGS